jgi:hypothetical protein
LTTPGVGRADVWVFDPDRLDGSLGGKPLNVITLFAAPAFSFASGAAAEGIVCPQEATCGSLRSSIPRRR